MSQRKPSASLAWTFVSLLLQLLSFIVPARRRNDWIGEWSGELWQARDAGWTCEGYLRFAWGAVPDALCLLLEFREEPVLRAVPASQCLLVLAALAMLTTATAFSLPRVRAEFRQMNWHSSEDVSILFLPNASNEADPTITPERFLLWKERAHYLQAIGFYQIETRNVGMQGASIKLRIAHGTGNLGWLVGESDSFRSHSDTRTGGLILSRRTWRREFRSEQFVEEKSANIDGRSVRISGVADLEDSGLPGTYDAWLFDSKPFQTGKPGFVLGQFHAGAETSPYFGFQHFSISEASDAEISGLGLPVSERKTNPWWTLALGLVLSLLALPATTPLGFGEKVRTSGRASAWQRLQRVLFMNAKCLLWAEMAASTGLVAASVFSRADWRLSMVTQILITFTVALLGFRWSIHDQRRRCPACLKPLTNPAHVGEPSRNFLSWNGTELVCASGHGLMHVPAHATSWFGEQRWLALDPSWHFLFATKR